MSKKIAFSGVQPSGQPSLGNYLGAFKQFVGFQETHQTYYCVVDHHAITVRQDPKALTEQTYAIAAWYLASGLDPAKCTLFIQSHVSAHAELGWILSTFTQMGELERMTQFKDKASRHKHNVNGGLFTYPTLMAADILLYGTHEVPVGHDQLQHIELTRTIAERFNGVYGDVLTMPKAVIPKAAARVKDLQNPTKKMSKSDPGLGTILLLDDLQTIEKKVKKAVTDTVGKVQYDEENQPGVANLLGIYAALTNQSIEAAVQDFDPDQYGPFKQKVADAVVASVEPIQARYHELMGDKAELNSILKAGADNARTHANATLTRVYDAMGYVQLV